MWTVRTRAATPRKSLVSASLKVFVEDYYLVEHLQRPFSVCLPSMAFQAAGDAPQLVALSTTRWQ
jgi:hypothetical protein